MIWSPQVLKRTARGPEKQMLFSKRMSLFILPIMVAVLAMNPGAGYCAGTITEYSIHVSSFKNERNAAEAQAAFSAAGLESFSKYENVAGKGMWHRVYVGHFKDKIEAQILGRQLKAQGRISYFKVIPMTRPQTTVSVRNKMPAHVDVTHLTPLSNIFPAGEETGRTGGKP